MSADLVAASLAQAVEQIERLAVLPGVALVAAPPIPADKA
jgi:hypothetical protein